MWLKTLRLSFLEMDKKVKQLLMRTASSKFIKFRIANNSRKVIEFMIIQILKISQRRLIFHMLETKQQLI